MNTRPVVLVADDDESLCQQLGWALQEDYRVYTAYTPTQIRRACARYQPSIVLLDLNYREDVVDGSEGLQLLEQIQMEHQDLKIIVMTGNHEHRVARQALEAGAYDHLLKPIDINELRVVLKRATFALQVEEKISGEHLTSQNGSRPGGIVGESAEIKKVLQFVNTIQHSDATVLITGESGTGKELVARLIHNTSRRRSGPFVPINCGAVPENLLESEFFGHEKGAFTGAVSQRIGKFELANGGTIFLDEIGELPPQFQVKLLRFLQDRRIERVGGHTLIELDVRILAATNRSLEHEVKTGSFREDLYYRLNVLNVHLAPLRERAGDIILLAQHFLRKFAKENCKQIRGFSPQAVELLKTYPWPGNVRELENKVHKAVILARHSVLLPADLEINRETRPQKQSLKSSLDQVERNMLIQAFRRNRGVVSHVARELNINRSTLYDLLKKHDIEPAAFKNRAAH